MNKTIVIVISTAVVAGALLAQEKAPQPAPADQFIRLEGGAQTITLAPNTMQFVSGMNVGPTTTGAPYSAEAVNESVQTLYDGNRIVEKSTTKQYRDSEGRERREEGSSMNAIFITDPVAKMSYTLHPSTMTAEKSSFAGPSTFIYRSTAAGTGVMEVTTAPVGTAAVRLNGVGPGIGKGVGTGIGTGVGRGARSGGTDPSLPPPAPGGRGRGAVAVPATAGAFTAIVVSQPGTTKTEDLGTKMLEGVQAKGTRTVTTIRAGQIGNDRDIEVVDERWYSPDLQLTVMTTHSDPRSGQTTYKLTNIQRIEQVRSMFEIPSNYTVSESGFVRLAQPVPAPAKKE